MSDQIPKVDPTSRWADFRRLCLYYAQCVRLEERASISAYAEKEGGEFICLPGPIDWRSVSSGQKIRLIADETCERFLRQGRVRGPCTTLFLGTPTDVFVGQDKSTGDKYRIISPVFVTAAVAKLDGGYAEIQPTGVVEINHGWLERRIPRAHHRREFLEQIGLAPTSIQDDEQEELWAVNGFEVTVRSLFACRQEWWKEYPDLQKLGVVPPLSAIEESGLRNRAVLMVQPGLKFTKRLYNELHRLAIEVSDEDLDQTSLVTLFPHKPPTSPSQHEWTERPRDGDVAEFCLLNDDQRRACSQALTQRLTVVTGPPGTGKSMVVAHVLANAALNGRAALFASRNHQALEAVEPRLNAMTEPETLVLRPTRPFGAHAAQFEWYRGMTMLLSRPRRDGIGQEKSAAEAAVRAALDRRREMESCMADLLTLEEELVEAEATVRMARQAAPAAWHAAAEIAHVLPSRETVALIHDKLKRLSLSTSSRIRRVLLWLFRSLELRTLRTQFRSIAVQMNAAVPARPGFAPPSTDASPTAMQDICAQWLQFIDLSEASRRCESIKGRLVSQPGRDELVAKLRESRSGLESAAVRWLRIAAESSGASISGEQRESFAQLRKCLKSELTLD